MTECIASTNLFQPTGFKVTINRKTTPNVSFFAQTVQHPGVTASAAEVAIPRLSAIPMPPDKVTFGEVNMMILLDEDMMSYKEIYNWMLRLVNDKYVPASSETDEVHSSHDDVIVTALTSSNNPNVQFRYVDAIPTSLGDISFEASTGDLPTVVFPVSFRYMYFEIT